LKLLGIIPARYHSARFPGKPLAMIAGKSMIFRVYEQASKAKFLLNVIVATDDERILHVVKSFGGEAVMTSSKHRNGTERCAEALSLAIGDYDAVINIQGDEPFIQPEQIELAASCLKEGAAIATLVKRIENSEEYKSSSVVKALINKHSEALYFSRSPLPFVSRKLSQKLFREYHFYKHIGIYGYQSSVLQTISALPPSPLEQLESLEQLRWLENGYKITVKETEYETRAIDTPEDLEQILKTLRT